MKCVAKSMEDVNLSDIAIIDLNKLENFKDIYQKCYDFARLYYILNKKVFEERGQSDEGIAIQQTTYGKLAEVATQEFFLNFDKSGLKKGREVNFDLFLPSSVKAINDGFRNKLKAYKNSLIGKPDEIKNVFIVKEKNNGKAAKSWDSDFETNSFKYNIKSQDTKSQKEYGISHTFGWGNSDGKKDASLLNTKEEDLFVATTVDLVSKKLFIRFVIQGSSIQKILDLPKNPYLIEANSKRMIYLSDPDRISIVDFLNSPDFKFYTKNNIQDLFENNKIKEEVKVSKTISYWKEPEKEIKVSKLNYNEDIKKLTDKNNLITAVGDEPWFRDQVFKKIKSIHPNLETICLDCEENTESEIFSKLSSRDLFTSKRIFLIKNFIKIKKLNLFLNNSNRDVILLDSEKASKSKEYQELLKKSLNIDCSKPKPWFEEGDALGKILGYFKMRGYRISQDLASYIYSQFGYNLFKIISEIEKILIFKGNSKNDDSEITQKDIDQICVTDIHFNIFDIIDKILSGKKKEALKLIDIIFKSESNPSILLINLWYTHFENLLYLKTTRKKENELSSYIKMPPMVIQKKLIPQSKAISSSKILESMNYLISVDYGIRKGSFDTRYYLEKFILDF